MTSPWVLTPHPPRPDVLQLLAVPFAGGGAGLYRRWQPHLPDDVDIVPIQLPGRETRMREPALNRIDDIVGQALRACEPWLGGRWAIFGHSMGGVVAHELARAAVAAGAPAPEVLFVSARVPPGTPPAHPPVRHLDDTAFLAAIEARFGAFPEAVRRHPGILQALVPTLRADLEALETHEHAAAPRLPCPIVTLAGEDDTTCPPDIMSGWAQATSANAQHLTVPGGHFFVREGTEARDQVARHLMSLVG